MTCDLIANRKTLICTSGLAMNTRATTKPPSAAGKTPVRSFVQFLQVGDSIFNQPVGIDPPSRRQFLKILQYFLSGLCNPDLVKCPDGIVGVQYALNDGQPQESQLPDCTIILVTESIGKCFEASRFRALATRPNHPNRTAHGGPFDVSKTCRNYPVLRKTRMVERLEKS